MINFNEPLNDSNTFKTAVDPQVLGDVIPADDSFGLVRHEDQDGFLVYNNDKVDYDIYLFNENSGTWFLYGPVTGEKSLVIIWQENISRVYFKTIGEVSLGLIGLQGPLIADVDPSDGLTSKPADMSLVQGSVTVQPTFGAINPASSVKFSTDGAGQHFNTGGGTLTVDTGLSYVGGEYISIAPLTDLTLIQIGLVTDYTGDQLTFDHVSNNGNADFDYWKINLSSVPGEKGEKGESGVVQSGQFSWDGQTTGFVPQSGEFAWSGEQVYESITNLTFHKEDAEGTDQSDFLDQYLNAKSGQIKIILDAHNGHHNIFQIVGASIDVNGNYKFDVYCVEMKDEIAVSSGDCTVYFVLAGAQGADGTYLAPWTTGETEENRLFLDTSDNTLKIIISGITYKVDLTAV